MVLVEKATTIMVNRGEEQLHAERFLRLSGEAPHSMQQGERPDFRLTFGDGRVVGLEHTRVFQEGSPPLQETESNWVVAMGRLGDHCRELAPPHLLIDVDFSEKVPLPKSGLKRFHERMIAVLELIRGLDNSGPARWLERSDLPGLPEQVEVLRVGPAAGERTKCIHGAAAQTPAPTQERVQEIIDGKSGKLGGYDTNCSEHWLLLVSDGSSLAATVDEAWLDAYKPFRSSFTRIYWLAVGDELFRLPVDSTTGR